MIMIFWQSSDFNQTSLQESLLFVLTNFALQKDNYFLTEGNLGLSFCSFVFEVAVYLGLKSPRGSYFLPENTEEM